MNPSDDTARHELQPLRDELARSQRQVADMAAAQEEFLRAVSHDLRAPLRHVTSYGTLVREVLGDLPPEVVQGPEVQEALGFLATMDHSARRMGQMMDGLLAIAHAGRAPLRIGAVDLAHAIAQARTELAGAEAGRVVHWDVAAFLPAVQADAEQLHTVLVQLLGNALKFTRGMADARITVQADPVAAGRVRITVQDNGVGFDGTRAPQLFGVFQRMHREADFEGVGAGLALCDTIARRHGASMRATSAPGAGCTLHLDWPAAAAPVLPS